jgi:hypothetical protein
MLSPLGQRPFQSAIANTVSMALITARSYSTENSEEPLSKKYSSRYQPLTKLASRFFCSRHPLFSLRNDPSPSQPILPQSLPAKPILPNPSPIYGSLDFLFAAQAPPNSLRSVVPWSVVRGLSPVSPKSAYGRVINTERFSSLKVRVIRVIRGFKKRPFSKLSKGFQRKFESLRLDHQSKRVAHPFVLCGLEHGAGAFVTLARVNDRLRPVFGVIEPVLKQIKPG